jgi:hypothetical protein
MPFSRRLACPVVLAWSLAFVSSVGAQAPGQTQTATVAVSLRVLPQAAFDGSGDGVSAALVPGQAWRIPPSAGARTRIVYTAATQVVVAGTPLVGPGGVALRVRFTCSFGGGMTVSAAEPFDCVHGIVAGRDGARLSSMPLAIGAELGAGEVVGLPAGLYAGRVTLTATQPAY